MKAVFNNSNPPLAPPPKKKTFCKISGFPFPVPGKKEMEKNRECSPPLLLSGLPFDDERCRNIAIAVAARRSRSSLPTARAQRCTGSMEAADR